MLRFFLAFVLFSASSINAANAELNRAVITKCLNDGEQQGVANKDCNAFDKALSCQAQMFGYFDAQLESAKRDLARTREEFSSARNPKRRELFGKAVTEGELAVSSEDKAVAKAQHVGEILRREKHEAGCD